jgi:hypothetical protein
VDEAGEPQDPRQVLDLRVAAVRVQSRELVERAVPHQPVDVPLAARRLDDDVGLGVKLLRQRLALVEVDEYRTDTNYVLCRSSLEVGLVDGDVDTGALRVQPAELAPLSVERSMQYVSELQALAVSVVVEGLEREL